VDANVRAMKNKEADYGFFNLGTGNPHSILEIADTIIFLCHKNLKPVILNKFRAGDIRHCYANTEKMESMLEFRPKITFQEGMKKLILWSENEKAVDLTRKAQSELVKRGLAE
jgi:dTDP-L-rhamnose 4-epimerase